MFYRDVFVSFFDATRYGPGTMFGYARRAGSGLGFGTQNIVWAVALRTHAFPCFLCNDRHFFFVLAIDEEKKDCHCAYFYALRQILGKWIDPCADGRIIASLRDGSKEQAGAKVKHGALHGTIVCLSLSVIVVCSPHPPLRGPPSPLGKALKIDLR